MILQDIQEDNLSKLLRMKGGRLKEDSYKFQSFLCCFKAYPTQWICSSSGLYGTISSLNKRSYEK